MSDVTNLHQTIGLRRGRGDSFLGEGWRFPTIESLFTKATRDQLIQQIPEAERYNIYFTAAQCWEGSGRKLASQDVIPFDVDKLELTGKTDEECHQIAEAAARTVCDVLQVRYEDAGVMFSGHGVWVFLWVDKPFTDPDHYNRTRVYYKDICARINQAFKDKGITGKCDDVVWKETQLCRMPDTLNKKENQPTRYARVLKEGITRITWTLEDNCRDLKVFEEADTVSKLSYGTPDVEGILAECEFLRVRATDHATEPELEWYARAGIYAFFPHGKDQYFHEHSMKYPDYDRYKTESKLEQARQMQTGPRKCVNIESITGNSFCKNCKHYKKVVTPFSIVTNGFIKTESTGFWDMVTDKETKHVKKTKPNYEDLERAFARQFNYVWFDKEKTIMVHNGKFWEDYSEQTIKAWLEGVMDPPPRTESQRVEFITKLRVKESRKKTRKQFDQGTYGLVNFKNCVLDIKTMQTHQHSPDFLFRNMLPFAYDPTATSPVFEKFVTDITNNPEDALALKQFGGWVLSGDEVTKRGRILVLIGSGSNGKGVYTDTLRDMITTDPDDKTVTNQFLTSLTKNKFTRYHMMKSLLNISSESDEDVFKDTHVLKQMTNGEIVVAELKGGGEFEYYNRTKLITAMNQDFKMYDMSHGFIRRLLVVRFTKTFGGDNDDKFIHRKLKAEIAGIFNSCIKAYKEMKASEDRLGTELPFANIERSTSILTGMVNNSDPLLLFMEECLVKDDKAEITVSDIHSAYLQFCDTHSIRNKLTSRQLMDVLRKKTDLSDPRKSNGKTFYRGYKLKDEAY